MVTVDPVDQIAMPRAALAERMIVLDGQQFSLFDYPFYHEIYNKTPNKLVLICGRQVAKTTTTDNIIITNAIARPFFKQLYVAPTQKQAQVFSSQRLGKTIKYSPLISAYLIDPKLANGVWHRAFANGADINVSYAYDDPDRARGLSADLVAYDEIQDIIFDAVVPVISEASANSDYSFEVFAGTPKTMDNPAEMLWSKSTKYEWFIKCEGCGMYNYVTSAKSLGKRGLICLKCGKGINSRNGFWYPTGDPNAELKGYHVPQPILPRNAEVPARWDKLLYKIESGTYSDTKIKNEVFGVSDATGTRLVNRDDMMRMCMNYTIDVNPLDQVFRGVDRSKITAGVDWSGDGKGTGTSLTSLFIQGYVTGTQKRRCLFYKTWVPGTHYVTVIDEIAKICDRFGVVLAVGDAGGGAVANAYLTEKLGGRRVLQSQYVASKTAVSWNRVDRLSVDRTAAIDSVMMMYRNGTYELPHAPQAEEYIQNVMALHETTTDTQAAGSGRRIWQRNPASADDLVHSTVYAGLAFDILTRQIIYYPAT